MAYKKRKYYFANKGPSSQGYRFSSGHVWMWELDCEEGWAPKNWCFWTVVLEKTLVSPLDCKEIQPFHPRGDQSSVFIGRTDAEAETPILWPPHVKSWLIGKDPDAGRDWGQEEKGTTEDEMAGWHHWLDGCEFGWTLGDVDGQQGLVCCDSWGCKESDTTERLNWTELRPVNNMGLNCMAPLTRDFFSIVNTITLHDLWNHGDGGLTHNFYVNFQLCGGWVLRTTMLFESHYILKYKDVEMVKLWEMFFKNKSRENLCNYL